MKLVNIVVLFSFLLTCVNPGPAFAGKSWTANREEPEYQNDELKTKTPLEIKETAPRYKSISSISSIKVPDELGKVVEIFAGDKKQIVIHIQDLHCNYEAQKNESKIIEYLNKTYGIGMVALEGAAGECDTTPFSNFPDKGKVLKTAETFLKKGQLTGAEYLKIVQPDLPLVLMGVEDKDLYLANLDNYREFEPTREQILSWADAISTNLNLLKVALYSKELNEVDSVINQYNENKLDLNKYIDTLNNYTVKYRVDLSGLDDVSNLIGIVKMESNIDFKEAEAQQKNFINELSTNLPRGGLTKLIDKSTSFKDGYITQGQYYSFLKDLLLESNLTETLSKKYNNLFSYFDYVIDSEKTNHSKLIVQLSEFTDRIKGKLFKNDNQRQLDKLCKNIKVIKDLVDIEASREELAYYKESKAEFNTAAFVDFLKKFPQTSGKADALSKIQIENLIGQQDEFYELAFKRDEALINNTVRLIKENLSLGGKIILITGGFHTPGMTKLLKQMNISYAIVAPKVTGDIDNENYKKLLLEDVPTVDELLNSEGESAQEKQYKLMPPLISGNLNRARRAQEIERLSIDDLLSSLINNLKMVDTKITAMRKSNAANEQIEREINKSIKLMLELIHNAKGFTGNLFDDEKFATNVKKIFGAHAEKNDAGYYGINSENGRELALMALSGVSSSVKSPSNVNVAQALTEAATGQNISTRTNWQKLKVTVFLLGLLIIGGIGNGDIMQNTNGLNRPIYAQASPAETIDASDTEFVGRLLGALRQGHDKFSYVTKEILTRSIIESNKKIPLVKQAYAALAKKGIFPAGAYFRVVFLEGFSEDNYAVAYPGLGVFVVGLDAFNKTSDDKIKWLAVKVVHEGTHFLNREKRLNGQMTALEDEYYAFKRTYEAVKEFGDTTEAVEAQRQVAGAFKAIISDNGMQRLCNKFFGTPDTGNFSDLYYEDIQMLNMGSGKFAVAIKIINQNANIGRQKPVWVIIQDGLIIQITDKIELKYRGLKKTGAILDIQRFPAVENRFAPRQRYEILTSQTSNELMAIASIDGGI